VASTATATAAYGQTVIGGGASGGEPPQTRAFGSQLVLMEAGDAGDADEDGDEGEPGFDLGSQAPRLRRTRGAARGHAAARWLLAPIDGITLGLFRIAFGYGPYNQSDDTRSGWSE
jgi:hypothetical protein